MTNEMIMGEVQNFINSNFPRYRHSSIQIEYGCVILNKGGGEQVFSICDKNSNVDVWGDGFIPGMNSFLQSLNREIKLAQIGI
jgi:hypothetical protein